ncbi:MAG: hypothetical protein K0S47_35 [Herbinix sp.]|jgi:hypothetical protein|nr:hypothetical protein [Herbinix sp.]
MKTKEGYELANILNEWLVVPIADKMVEMKGMITLSESGAFLWKLLQHDISIIELVSLLCDEYDVDRTTAENDVRIFIDNLCKIGLLQK